MNINQDNFDKLFEMIKDQEGFVGVPYQDSYGNLTVGYGWNIRSRPLSQDQAAYICASQLRDTDAELAKTIPYYAKLDDVRKSVIVDMAFQMGVKGVLLFVNMWQSIKMTDWNTAASDMLNSQWGREFKSRANVLAKMMKTGEWP